MSDVPKYTYAATTVMPRVGDKRRRNVFKKKGSTYCGKTDDDRKIEHRLTCDVWMDVEEEYKTVDYRTEWHEVSGYLNTAVPAPTRWARLAKWLGLAPAIPPARVIQKDGE